MRNAKTFLQKLMIHVQCCLHRMRCCVCTHEPSSTCTVLTAHLSNVTHSLERYLDTGCCSIAVANGLLVSVVCMGMLILYRFMRIWLPS